MKSYGIAKALPLVALAMTAGFATAAQAVVVNEWTYDVAAAFTSATPTGPGLGFVSGPTQISWGDPAGSIAVDGGRSALTIGNTPALGNVFTNGPAVMANTLTHSNNRVLLSFPQLDSASMQIDILLASFDPAIGDADPFMLSFSIDFKETNNNPNNPGPDICDDGAVQDAEGFGCRDIFVISAGDLTTTFDFAGETYKFSFFDLAGAIGPLSDAACAAAGADSGCVGFLTRELEENTIEFAFDITRVPEPGMLGLFGLGLIGLGAARRRKA